MVLRNSFLFDSKKVACFPGASGFLRGGIYLYSFPSSFFFSPLTLTRASSGITAGCVVLRVSETRQGLRVPPPPDLNPSLPRSVPGSSADPGGAQEAGGPVPHLLQPRFGPEHGPRRAFCECIFLSVSELERVELERAGWGLGEAPPTVRPRPHVPTARTVGLVGQQGTAQALPLGLCPASFRGPWLTCLVPGAAVRLSGGVGPGPGPVSAGCPEDIASSNSKVLRCR